MIHSNRINTSRRATTLLTFAALIAVSIVVVTSDSLAQPVRAESPAKGTISSLLLLGFDPDAFAACGGSGVHLDALRTAVGSLTTELDAFGASDETVRTLQAQIHEAEEASRSGGFSAARARHISQLKTNLETQRSTLNARTTEVRAALFDVLAQSVSASDLGLIKRFVANRERSVPIAYRVLDLNAKQWRDLESALRRSSLPWTNLSSDESFELSRAKSSLDVSAVNTRFRDLLPALNAAYAQALAAEIGTAGP